MVEPCGVQQGKILRGFFLHEDPLLEQGAHKTSLPFRCDVLKLRLCDPPRMSKDPVGSRQAAEERFKKQFHWLNSSSFFLFCLMLVGLDPLYYPVTLVTSRLVTLVTSN